MEMFICLLYFNEYSCLMAEIKFFEISLQIPHAPHISYYL